MWRFKWSSGVSGTLAVAALLGAVVCGRANATADVVGYRSGDKVWVLGARIGDVDLDTFKPLPTDEPELEAYLDRTQTIKFRGEDADAYVALFFKHKKLAVIAISVPAHERTYRYLRRYYSERLDGCEVLQYDWDASVWADDEDDYLALFNSYENESVTLIMYARAPAIGAKPTPEVPSWVEGIIQSL